jgi:Zn-dependent protease
MLLRLGSIQDDPQSFIILLLALVISLLLGLTFHEFNHAIVADRLGDPGPRAAGRLSLNPLHHLDPMGTILLFLVGFGWAKPVPVNPYRLRNGPTLGMATVAAAGPISNFVLAALFSIPFVTGMFDNRFVRIPFSAYGFGDYLALLCLYLVLINVVLGVFNLIPLAPLDGSRVAQALLPGELGRFFRRIEPYGMGILFLLFMVSWLTNGQINIIGGIIGPIRTAVLEFLLRQ